ncbi:MAG: hypothetical protein PHY93_13365 [Bacteriovorax sp.]|nr:hypothetical protein [Bacteriovorax sp.]
MKLILRLFFTLLSLSFYSVNAIESSIGFVVTGYDDRFSVVSPEKFRSPMEVIVENKTLVRLIGKIVVNNKTNIGFTSVESDKYQRVMVNLKKGDLLHFIPLSPSFQEVELIVGNKTYEIPPKK